jgi:hypothetical protein
MFGLLLIAAGVAHTLYYPQSVRDKIVPASIERPGGGGTERSLAERQKVTGSASSTYSGPPPPTAEDIERLETPHARNRAFTDLRGVLIIASQFGGARRS